MTSRSRLVIALLSTGLVCYIFVGSLMNRVLGDSTYGQLALFGEVIHLVQTAYVEPVNVDRTMRGAELGLTEALDGDSAYLDAGEFRSHLEPSGKDAADVGLAVTRRFGFLVVVSVLPGSPADRADLRAGDVIKTIAGRHTRSIAAATGQRLLRGAPGSVVELTALRRGNDPIGFALVREKLAAAAPTVRTLSDGVALVKVPELSEGASDVVRAQIDTLKRSGTSRLVLDLRGSGFGAYPEAPRLAELFLSSGGVVARLARRRAAEETLLAEARRNAWAGPLVVLVDGGTAGPAELVAAALGESGRASLVGRRTFGRAGVQKAIPLYEGGLILTVARYVTPGGKQIHEQGVEPSVPIARVDEPGEGVDARDPILEKALEILRTQESKAAALDLTRRPGVLRWHAGRGAQSAAIPA